MATKKTEKTIKTFIVQRTYEVIVDAFDRDEAISMVATTTPTPDQQVGVKCGTPKQMRRVIVQ